jgi:hypothetical protein
MRTIHVCVDFDVHKAGDHIAVEDQVACDAIAQGLAVPSVDEIEKAFDPVEENRALDAAPEVK